MKAMQMPVDGMENQQWIGVEVDEDKVCDANSYIIVNSCDFANDLRSGNYAAGLVVDFWTESIPLKEQTAMGQPLELSRVGRCTEKYARTGEVACSRT